MHASKEKKIFKETRKIYTEIRHTKLGKVIDMQKKKKKRRPGRNDEESKGSLGKFRK